MSKTKNAVVKKAAAVAKAEMNQLEQAAQLKALGLVVIKKTIEAGSAYLDLCKYIRAKTCAPKLVTHELCEIGFHKARVSEIIRVAHASDEHFSQFEARTIGFRKTLELERGTVQELMARESGSPVIDIEAEVEEMVELENKTKVADTAETKARKVENAAKVILDYGEVENIRSKKWTLSNGWTLALTRDSDYKVKQAKAKLNEEMVKQAKGEKVANPRTASEHKSDVDNLSAPVGGAATSETGEAEA